MKSMTFKWISGSYYFAFLLPLCLVGNVLLIVTLWKNIQTKFEAPQYKFVMSLAFSDVAFSLLFLSFTIAPFVIDTWPYGHAFCQVHGCLNMTLAFASLLNLVAISVDRYYACCKPLHYHQKMTPRRVTLMIAAAWIYATVLALLPILGLGEYRYFANKYSCSMVWDMKLKNGIYVKVTGALCFFPSLLLIVFCYIKIYQAVKHQKQQVNQVNNYFNNTNNAKNLKKDFRGALTFIVVIIAYFITWVPYVGVHMVSLYTHSDAATMVVAENFVDGMFSLASAVNPFIYSVMHGPIKREIRKTVCCLKPL
ncbi:5-hydroxytryptamine receptor 4-like [Ptychodera flava]|uniref:5-hydroxytryptamine receptor 4-like n=1 Tax=Ptychodera flava TaxID=63121 RepID=UPI00396A3714